MVVGGKNYKIKKISNLLFEKNFLKSLKIKRFIIIMDLLNRLVLYSLECERCKSFVSSIFSEVLIRDKNFNLQKPGNRGLVQLFSVLPTSYPGHSIITEDIGEILPKNKIKCS